MTQKDVRKFRQNGYKSIYLLICTLISSLLLVSSAHAQQNTCTPYENAYSAGNPLIITDSNNLDFPTAIDCANQNSTADTIHLETDVANTFNFPSLPTPVGDATYVVTSDITVVGIASSSDRISILSNYIARIFYVAADARLSLIDVALGTGFEIADKDDTQNFNGGAIYNTGELTTQNVLFSRNYGVYGAALYNTGVATLLDTSIVSHISDTSNVSQTVGGSLIENTGTLTIERMDFNANNVSSQTGGAVIRNHGQASLMDIQYGGTVIPDDGAKIENTGDLVANRLYDGNSLARFVANSGDALIANTSLESTRRPYVNTSTGSLILLHHTASVSAGQIDDYLFRNDGNLSIYNSAFDISSTTQATVCDGTGTLTVANSLVNENPCATYPGADFTVASLTIDTFEDNGGFVSTAAIDTTSPLFEAGNAQWLSEAILQTDINGDGDTDDTLTADARGEERLVATAPDAGAYELQLNIPEDLNGDLRVTPVDVIYVINRLGGNDLSADVNDDGSVTTDDVQQVLTALQGASASASSR